VSQEVRRFFLDAVECFGVLIEPAVSDTHLTDESDRKFYDAAKECSGVLVTGNLKHYPNEDFIMNPAGFLQRGL